MIVGTLTPQMWRSIWQLLIAMVLYTGLTIVTFGIKVPSGLFIPTMTVGEVPIYTKTGLFYYLYDSGWISEV